MSEFGIIKTVIWTQLHEATRKDFGVELPNKTGPEIAAAIHELAAYILGNSQCKSHHDALQRAGTAAGLLPGADIHTELVPAIEAMVGAHLELSEIANAIGSPRWMDPPDGGGVSLAEQVRRMVKHIEKLEGVDAEPFYGNLLPPVGAKVLIHLGREDAWVEHTVVGYAAWGDLGGNEYLHRVFIRVVDRDGWPNARLLKDVRLTDVDKECSHD